MRKFSVGVALFVLAARGVDGQQISAVDTPDSVRVVASLPLMQQFHLARYDGWIAELAACENMAMPSREAIDSLKFFFVNAREFHPRPSDKIGMMAGAAYAIQNEIYLSIDVVLNEATVKHEILHWLLFVNGKKEWDTHSEFFKHCGVRQFD